MNPIETTHDPSVRDGLARELEAMFSEPQTIGGNSYPPELIGTLRGAVSMEDVAPYLGIGYGNAVGPDTTWSFVFDVGVAHRRGVRRESR